MGHIGKESALCGIGLIRNGLLPFELLGIMYVLSLIRKRVKPSVILVVVDQSVFLNRIEMIIYLQVFLLRSC